MAEKRVVELEVKTTGADESEKSVKSLKARLRELKLELQGLDEGSDQFKKLVREAGELQDTIGDLNQQVKNFASDTRRLDATLEGIGAVAGAFGAVESTMALVGVESEELQQTMVRLQAAMTLVNSVQSIANALQKESALMTSISTIRTNLLTKSVVQQAVATGTATTAQKIMNAVMNANPIGLVITGVVALTGAYYALSKSLDDTIEKEKRLDEYRKNRRVEVDKELEQEIKKREARKGGLNDLENELRLLQSKGAKDKEIFEQEKKIIKERLNLLGYIQGYRGYLYREEYQQKKTLLTDLQVLENEYHKKQLDQSKKNTKERIDQYKINEEELWNETLAGANEIDKLDLERQKAKNDAEAEMTETISAFKIGIWEYEAQKQKELDQQALESQKKLNDLKFQATLQGLTLISDLAEVFGKKGEAQAKKAFKIQKAASIASALITTYQSAVSAYQSQFLPIPDPSSPVRGGIAAGIAVAAGLGNVAKISSQSFSGGSGASGGSSSSSTPNQVITPNFNLVGQSGANSLGQSTQPLQAYVVSGEVTSQQALDRNRLKNATFG